ncbi:MAG: hypothetical protein ACI35N_08605 [Marinilabiliaceae bacterium]
MGKVKVILYRKDGSKIGKLELDSDKDVREQLLPMKSRLGIYAYEVKQSWIDKMLLEILMSTMQPTIKKPEPIPRPEPIPGMASGRVTLL